MRKKHPLNLHANIEHVEKLYLEILYRCNFDCQHCFQGINLQRSDRFTSAEATRAIAHFHDNFSLASVTLCGGEPFLHPDLDAILAFAKRRHLNTAVCTNGYRVQKILRRIANDLDELRVSIDGIGNTHDAIRRRGSFQACLDTLSLARHLGVPTSITTTVTSSNAAEIGQLARLAAAHGVTNIKLHQLRAIGHAAKHPHLIVAPESQRRLVVEIRKAASIIPVLLDEDASPRAANDAGLANARELDRIEIQPNGRLYISCKAVGGDSNAFWYDKTNDRVQYNPTPNDELASCTPQVRYVDA